MPEEFHYDVFLSHSAKDKAVLRPRAKRLHAKVEVRRTKDEMELQPLLRAFASDWAQLEAGTCGRRNLRFRDPLNRERRFIPLRLDDAPIKGSLAQFLYINWHPATNPTGVAQCRN